MNDRTVQRACRAGAKTTPIEGRKPRRLRIYNNVVLTKDEIELAVEMARGDRLEQQLRDYAHKRQIERMDDGASAVRNVIRGDK